LQVEGNRQRVFPKKTQWDCVKDDMESIGLSQRMRSLGINGGDIREDWLTQVNLENGC